MQCVPADVAEAVLAALPNAVHESVTSAPLLGWVPTPSHVALCKAWHRALGDDGYRTVFREAFLAAVDAPFLGIIVKGSLRIFGRTPSAAVRAWAVGWPYVFRNGGAVEIVEAGQHNAVIRVVKLPPSLRDESFALGVAGSFDGNAELVGKHGVTTYDTGQLRRGTIELALDWT